MINALTSFVRNHFIASIKLRTIVLGRSEGVLKKLTVILMVCKPPKNMQLTFLNAY